MLGYSQLMTLWWFQMKTEGTQLYIHICAFSPKLPSHQDIKTVTWHWAQSHVLCSASLLVTDLKHSMCTCWSRTASPPLPRRLPSPGNHQLTLCVTSRRFWCCRPHTSPFCTNTSAPCGAPRWHLLPALHGEPACPLHIRQSRPHLLPILYIYIVPVGILHACQSRPHLLPMIYIYIYSTSGYTACMPVPASFVIHYVYTYSTSVHIVYKSILTSQFIPSPAPLVYICLFSMSVSLSLPCK